MKKRLFLICGGFLWLIIATLHPPLPSEKHPLLFYSNQLHQDLKAATIQAIKGAKSSITLQIYGLSDPDIIALLEKKQAEGVDVTIFYDKTASKSLPKTLQPHPIKTTGLMHRKILVVDKAQAFLGTANFTTQSLKMHDNIIVGAWNPQLATFLRNSTDSTGSFELGNTSISAFLLPDFTHQAIEQLKQRLKSAKKDIQVAMFTLTHPELVEELIQAQKRGIEVSVAIDRYTFLGASQKAIEKLQHAGAAVLISQGSQLLHHKWALIDQNTLIIGSANWTKSAFENNQDCFLILDELASSQKKQLQKLWQAVAIASEKL